MAETNPNLNNPAPNPAPNPATPAPTPTPAAGPAAPNYDDLFAKLDSILDKRSDGLAKSALKDNGIEESEIAEIVKAYRAQKASTAQKQADDLTNAQARVAALEKEIADRDLTATLTDVALNELKLDPKIAPYATRLVDRSTIVDAAGKPDAAKTKEALEKVLTDIPALKNEGNNGKGFVPVGAKTQGNPTDNPEAKLRSFFGL